MSNTERIEARDLVGEWLSSTEEQEYEARIRLLDSIDALTAERDDFHMAYRLKCDAETKALIIQRDRLAQEAADAASLRLKYADADTRCRDLTAERDRLAKALRAILRNPVVLKLPRDYSPMTTDTWDAIDAALQEKRDGS